MRIVIEVIDPLIPRDVERLQRELDNYFVDNGIQAVIEVEP